MRAGRHALPEKPLSKRPLSTMEKNCLRFLIVSVPMLIKAFPVYEITNSSSVIIIAMT